MTPTMPPSPAETAALAAFEHEIGALGEEQARLRNLAAIRMNPSVATAYAASFVAAAAGIPRKVACLCTYCLEDIDPAMMVPVHRAPDSSECEICSDPVRWSMGGFVFAVLPAAG